jgi:hypothetical protein
MLPADLSSGAGTFGPLETVVPLIRIDRAIKKSELVAVAEWSTAWIVLARLDAGIVGSDPTRGKVVYMYVYYFMFVFSYVGRGPAMSWSLIQGVLPCVSK